MKSHTTRLVVLLCLFISVTTGFALAVAPAQTYPPSAPSDADILRAGALGPLDAKLVPIGGATTPEENIALAKAINSSAKSNDQDDHSALLNFLRDHPRSPWRAAILTNIGICYRKTGWFMKALAAWKEAWELSKHDYSPLGKPLADRAIGELAELNTVLGRKAEVEKVLKELGDRPLMGPATEKVTVAREGLWLMRHEPENVLKCGPFALARIAAGDNRNAVPHPDILSAKATEHGTSLEQVWKLSRQVGMNYQMAKRKPGADVIVPSVVNWKANHFAAVVGEHEGKFLVKDPTSSQNLLVSKAALDAETSGYSLVPAGPLPEGWSRVSETEGRRVWGAGGTLYHNPGTKPWDDKAKKCSGSLGMATYNFHTQVVSLNIMDTPVGYTPPVGPDMHFTVTYNQRELVDDNETVSNFGSNWVCNWIAHVSRTFPGSWPATVYLPGGGVENFSASSGPQMQSGATLTLTGDPKIEESYFTRTMPDGSYQVFEILLHSHRYYMTQWTDPQGNTVLFNYEGFRLTSVTDALGQSTQIEHNSDVANNLPDYYLIKKITDPFGGYATFEYNDDHQLVRIQDAVGIVSEFHYEKGTDFVDKMTTPYAITHFSRPESNLNGLGQADNARVIQAQDHETGDIERVEFGHLPDGVAPEILASEPESALPTPAPIPIVNGGYRLRNTFYWDKKTTQMYPPVKGVYDYTKAKIIHWVHDSPGFELQLGNVKEREKMPLENPVYYFYLGQSDPRFAGPSSLPSAVARVLGDGTTELWKYEYNSRRNLTKATDPKGRVTHYDYAANGIDLIGVFQKNPKGYNQYPDGEPADRLFEATYNASHQPLTVRDTGGNMTTYTYTTGLKQLETVTNARSETTTYTYGDGPFNTELPLGYLIAITSAAVNNASAVRNFTYENGRVRTVTSNPDGYMITIDSDHLNRPTQITYPDKTTEEFHYTDSERGMTLDLTESKDRLNRWTYRHYNPDRNMDSITDDLTQTSYDWCSCGSLNSITDPNGNTTVFNRDVQGRVHQKMFQDTRTINYLYEGQTAPNTPGATSRLKSATDALNRRTNYTYFRDNNIQQVSYTDTAGNPLTPPTPTVSYTYDPNYNRIEKMIEDGTIETAYIYYYVGTPPYGNDGKLQSIDGPLGDDTVTFIYDELGRTISQTIEGGGESTVAYDALGRLTTSVNALGEFGRTYFGPTSRLDTLTYPNAQQTRHVYFGNGKDRRLQTLENLDPQTMNLSKFDYDYDAEGQILSWARQLGNASSGRWFAYDEIRRLLGARNHSSPTSATEVNSYGYDDAGNRTSDSKFNPQGFGGNGLFHFYTPNNLNQIESFTTEENGMSGVDVPLAHDFAGNLTDNGEGKTFEWDAANRLRAINHGSGQRSEFTYDGLSRRVKIVEKTGSTVTSTKQFVWVGNTIAQERDGDNKVTRQYFAEGEKRGEKSHYYTRDHLGSIRELTDGEGTLLTRYDYDPYGQRTKLAGTEDVDFGYTGHYHHAPSGLILTHFRAYNPAFGRWLSRDPIGEEGGLNLYAYVDNNPANRIDPLGLDPYLPDRAMKPPGWNPSWPTGTDSRGDYSQGPNGQKWYPHPEDGRHWPHYDSDTPKVRYPEKCIKPHPGQKKPPYGRQSPTNPWPTPAPPAPWWLRLLRSLPLPGPPIITPHPSLYSVPPDPRLNDGA